MVLDPGTGLNDRVVRSIRHRNLLVHLHTGSRIRDGPSFRYLQLKYNFRVVVTYTIYLHVYYSHRSSLRRS